jgi:hypothetical protein
MRKDRWVRLALVVGIGAVVVLAFQFLFKTDVVEDTPTKNGSEALEIANTFPVPPSATQAFPDSTFDNTASKGWRAAGTIAEACGLWREAYRGWVDPGQAGSVTGEDEPGRRCTLSGPKSGFTAELSLTVYGDDPTPSVVLTVRPKSQ